MTRTAVVPVSRRRPWIGLAILPFALAACEGKPSTPELVDSKAPGTPTTGTVSVIPAGGLSPATPAPAPTVNRVVTYEVAESSYTAGRFGEAKELFEGYVSLKPENPFGHYMLGLSSWKSGDLVRAESAFDTALELDPSHVKSWVNSARVLLDLKRDHEALERADQALTLEPGLPDALRLRARAQERLGNLDGARQSYRDALVSDERDVWSLNNLGVLELQSGQAEAALRPLARAVQLRGNAPLFQNNLGMALERSGYPGAALKAYEAAVKSDSTFQKAVKNLERLSAVDGVPGIHDGPSLVDLAEEFRQQVRLWKDSAPRVVPVP
jgi:tetratricopeptide (TPR) repeat protein